MVYHIEDRSKYIISKEKQEEIDRKLGYIKDDNYYTDGYLDILKSNIENIDNLYEKVKYVLENIEIYKNPNINYINRQWYHVRILEYLFDEKIFNYDDNLGLIRVIDCYKDNDSRHYYNCITVEDKNNIHIFLYNSKEYRYQELDIDYFINAASNGLIMPRNKIREVEKVLRKK